MDFTLNEEQTLLQDTVARFVRDDYAFDDRRKLVETPDGFSREHWKMFAQLGWLGLPFAESDGGFGGGAVETMLVFESFGKGLVVEPYLATVVLAGGAPKLAGTPAQKQARLEAVIEGSLQGALAYSEPQARFNLANVATTAKAKDRGYVINGHKTVVFG